MKYCAFCLSMAVTAAWLAPAALAAEAQTHLEAGGQALLSPGEIVARAARDEWVEIPADDLLVMDLAPDQTGQARRIVIQLMPPPFSQGWVKNIRILARAHWWDGTNVYRVQDNYVAQWGDVLDTKPLPQGMGEVPKSEYQAELEPDNDPPRTGDFPLDSPLSRPVLSAILQPDPYAKGTYFSHGWPLATNEQARAWPVHCYGTVGVARGLDNTGSGAELYAVIGHAPRHLDRNIAVVGRVIAGMEFLSTLPRGDADDLGFYHYEDQWVPVASVRLGSAMETPAPRFEYLSTQSERFIEYAGARANRRDPFFLFPAGGADICNIPVPVREMAGQ